MDDTISRQSAIDALDKLCDRECEYSKKQRSVMCGACHLGSAFDVVEQLPSAQPEKRTEERTETHACDLISRQSAIDALADYIHNIDKVYSTGKLSAYDCKDAAESVIEQLPPARPIIRCKDCLMHGVCRFEQGLGLDGYCSQAERSE